MKEAGSFSQQARRDELLLAAGDEGKKGLAVKLGAVAGALLLTALLLGGYFFLRGRQIRDLQARQQAAADAARKSAPPPRAQVFQDEVMLRGSKAVVGGSVRNISGETLEGLSVEIELKSRDGQKTGTSSVTLEPASLRPGEEGRFAFQITPSDWSGTRVSRLLSANAGAEIPFKPEMGAKRPPERAPAPKVIVVPRPKPKGDDFLNTPDTPIRIP